MSRYRCPYCGKVVRRDSDKAWLKSWCESSERDVRLMRVTGTKTR